MSQQKKQVITWDVYADNIHVMGTVKAYSYTEALKLARQKFPNVHKVEPKYMNHITVVANGSPGSFVRRVQEDPQIAVNMLYTIKQAYRVLAAINNNWPGRNTPEGQKLLNDLRNHISDATGETNQDVQDAASKSIDILA